MVNTEKAIRDVGKRSNIHVFSIPENKERENRANTYLKR